MKRVERDQRTGPAAAHFNYFNHLNTKIYQKWIMPATYTDSDFLGDDKFIPGKFFVHSRFGFSLISTKTQKLVKSLNIKAAGNNMDVSAHLVEDGLEFTELNFALWFSNIDWSEEARDKGKYYKWSLRQWVDHIKSTFIINPILVFDLENEILDTARLRDSLAGTINSLVVTPVCSDQHIQRILSIFLGQMETLVFACRANASTLKHVPIQNLKVLRLCPTSPFTLDHFLSINAPMISLGLHCQLSHSDFRRFLRAWTRGACTRMEYLYLVIRANPDLDIGGFFRGITHQIMGIDVVRRVKDTVRDAWGHHGEVQGGVDVRNRVGIIATIRIRNMLSVEELVSVVEMFVWN